MPTRYPTKTGVQWRAVVKIDGRVLATRLFPPGMEGKRDAAQWERDERIRLLSQPIATPTALPTVLEWSNRYAAYSEQRHGKQTFKEKKAVFKLFFSFLKKQKLGINEIEQITPDIAMQYLQAQNADRSGFASNKDRKNLAAAWEWGKLFINEFPKNQQNPFWAVPKFKEERQPRYVPPERDFWAVVEVATGQDKAMLLSFFYSGARRSEVFRLKWLDDVDFKHGRIRLGTRKTKDGSMSYAWLPMPEPLKQALHLWQQERPYKTEWVFTILDDSPSPHHTPGEPFRARQHFMTTICKRAKVKPFGFHAIRHLHASILFNEGEGDIRVVQLQLRHSNPNTTARYLHTLGYESTHGQKVLSVMENRTPAKVTAFAELQMQKAL